MLRLNLGEHTYPYVACQWLTRRNGARGYKLPPMMMRRAGFSILSITLAVLSACRDQTAVSRQDTISTIALPPIPVAVPPVNPGWESDRSGPVLLLAVAEKPSLAQVVLPRLTDSAATNISSAAVDSLQGMSFGLLDRAGESGTARLASRNPSVSQEGCISWPVAAFEKTPPMWRIGFKQGTVTPLPLDSLEGMTSADSLQITTELARLASALPESNDPAFQGLPFSVRKAYRSGPGGFLVGDIVRRINEEANPREEHFLIIAERSSDSRYSTAFHSRSAGSEDVVRTTDILAAVRFVDGGNSALIISYEYEDGGRIALIERDSGRWRQVWRSAYTGC